MDYFGLNRPDELPKINEVLADQIVEPTLVNAEHFEVEGGEIMAVTGEGELVESLQTEGTSPDEGSGETPRTAEDLATDGTEPSDEKDKSPEA